MGSRRQSVLVDIEELLGAARGGAGGAIMVEGPAGIGKSVMLEQVAALTGDARVVTIAGSEAERDMPLAAVTQLCMPLLNSVERIPAHQARLVRVALGLDVEPPPIAGGNQTMALGLTLLSLLVEAGRESGIVVIVDDAQWLDPSSKQVFEFVSRRLTGTSIALIAARRPGEAGPHLSRTVALGLLSHGEALELLVGYGLERHVAANVVDRSPGLPMLLRHIADSLTDQQRSGVGPLPDPLPAGADLEAAYVAALEPLSGQARRALLLLAALGDHDLADVDPAAVEQLDVAEAAGLLRVDTRGQRFVSPIARSAAYWAATPADRRAAHLAIADSMEMHNPAEVWHRSTAAAGRDDVLAGRLIESGRRITARGGAASSVVAFQRAAELAVTPDLRIRALTEGAAAALVGGSHRVAELLVAEAESAGGEPAELLAVQAELATVAGSPERARQLLDRLADVPAPIDPEMADAARVASALTSLRLLDIASARESLVHVSAGCTPRVGRRVEVVKTMLAARRSDPSATAVLPVQLRRIHQVDRAADDVRFLAEAVTLALGWMGGESSLLALADELHRRSGDSVPGIVPSLQLARAVYLSRSDLAGAAAAASQAVELAGELGLHAVRLLALPWLASVQAGLCAPETLTTCRTVEASGGDLAMVTARLSLGFFHLGREEYDAAHSTLMTLHHWSAGEASLGMYWQADLAEAALRVGQREVAHEQRRILEHAAASTASPWLLAVHERVAAQLCEDLDEAVMGFEAAIVRLHEHDFTIAAARAALLLGERLRRGRRRTPARERLREARAAFDRAGMSTWVLRCDRELTAAGSPQGDAAQRAHAILTPQELQVARWVVAGESNREIAARLFISPRTIEAHLSTIYRKLGIRGRSDLTARAHRDTSLLLPG